jgi:hypothetical protein
MSRTRTPRDLPAQDPIDRLDESSARLRQVASDLYSADVNEITKKTEVHVHVSHPSQPDGRVSDLPPVPMSKAGRGGVLGAALGAVAGLAALAKALGLLP